MNIAETIFSFASKTASKTKDGASSVKQTIGDFSGDFSDKAEGAANIVGNMFRSARTD